MIKNALKPSKTNLKSILPKLTPHGFDPGGL